MEFLTILLSGLLAIVSPTTLVAETIAEKTIRDRVTAVESLDIRIDNAPNYQILNRKVDRVRLASRGMFPLEDVRIDTLEIETDAIALTSSKKVKLAEPLRAGIRLILTQADVNRALTSKTVTDYLKRIGSRVIDDRTTRKIIQTYEVLNPKIDFLANQRLRMAVTLRDPKRGETLDVFLETGLAFEAGHRPKFTQPIFLLDGRPPFEDPFLVKIMERYAEKLDLKNLDPNVATARVLKCQITDGQAIELATFVELQKF